uniref:Uncharacterized protein n=1 Tax=viral metagenome TaxID=1070528 RepID=A0A6C0J4U5_9ZZZZ
MRLKHPFQSTINNILIKYSLNIISYIRKKYSIAK